jgi:hypothetical protein
MKNLEMKVSVNKEEIINNIKNLKEELYENG